MDNDGSNTINKNKKINGGVDVLDKPESDFSVKEKVGNVSGSDDVSEISDYIKRQKTFRYKSYLFFKRTFDIIFSGILILLLSWLYIIIAIAVKISDGGRVFFIHSRIGKNGKNIKIAKFRSMKKNAENLNESLSEEQLKEYKKEYKLEQADDNRITKLGKFLRKTSLDELPNFFAVFTGKISIVGPRPVLRDEAYDKYGKDVDKFLSVKPGIVGWWAVNGRNNSTYCSGKRQALELYYVDKCSIWFDLKILFKTVGCVFKRTGAK